MLRSGDPCPLNGLYRTSCGCAETLELIAGNPFPSCISCGEAVAWVNLQSLAPTLDPANPGTLAALEAQVRKLQACLRREGSGDPALLFALGRLLLRLGRIGPALEVIHAVLDSAPTNPSVHLELGRALLAFRQPRDAWKVLQRGAEIARQLGDAEAEEEFAELMQSAQPIEERRLGEMGRRVPLNVTVTRSDALVPGHYAAVNISETGLRIRSSRRETVGSFVALDFLLQGTQVHVYAKVVWCRDDLGDSAELPFSVGLMFINPSRLLVQRLRAYVRERMEGGDSPCPSPLQAESRGSGGPRRAP